MKLDNIQDSELVEFCQWYKSRYGKGQTEPSVMITCLCGYFHTYPKQAIIELSRLNSLELISQKNNIVYLK